MCILRDTELSASREDPGLSTFSFIPAMFTALAILTKKKNNANIFTLMSSHGEYIWQGECWKVEK